MDIDDLIEFLSSLGVAQEYLDEIRTYQEHVDQNAGIPAAEEADKFDPTTECEGVDHDFLYAVADQRHMIQRPKRKWYSPSTSIGDRRGATRLTKKKGICFHHTAVKGGFGTHASVRKDVEGQIVGGKPGEIDLCTILKINKDLTDEEKVRLHALGARYRGAGPKNKYNNGIPYHAVRGANSVLYLNLPFDWVTWHGNASNNDFLGFGWDARSTADSPEPEDMIQDVLYMAKLMEDEGHECAEFVTHSMYTRKPKDPWKPFIEQVVIPAAEKLGAKVIMDKKYGKGQTIERTLAA